MEKFKSYFKYVNQWSLLFWGFIALQIILFAIRENDFWDSFWSCVLIWGFYMLGYNSLDRKLDIMLQKAKEEIANRA